MYRREYLAALAAGGAALSAGCVGARVDEPTPAPRASSPTPGRRLEDVDLPVPRSELVQAIHSAIPAIVEPAFADDWSGVELSVGDDTVQPRLRDDTPVIGIERRGTARAYPLGVLERHEVVNDAFPGPTDASREPLLVTYCPSCGSSMAAIRRVQETPTRFEVSHFLWRSNLVLRDGRTGSLWSQLLAGAIHGPATGAQLPLVPSTLTRWERWQEAHPATEVLLPPPLSKTIYDVGRSGYEYDRFTDTAPIIGEDSAEYGTGRTLVIGITVDGAAKAYPFEAVRQAGVVNDHVGGMPVLVAAAPGGTLVAYHRRIGSERLRFRRADESTLVAGGSRWLIDRGLAIDGPLEGTQLRRANDVPPLFRFAWEGFHPDTSIYGEAD